LGPDHQLREGARRRDLGHDVAQHRRRDLAAAAAAVGEGGQAHGVLHREGVLRGLGSGASGYIAAPRWFRPCPPPPAMPEIEVVTSPDPALLARFDALIDVRSPAEFAEDHVPGAVNLPVLDNEERAKVGTIYVQDSRFRARRV